MTTNRDPAPTVPDLLAALRATTGRDAQTAMRRVLTADEQLAEERAEDLAERLAEERAWASDRDADQAADHYYRFEVSG